MDFGSPGRRQDRPGRPRLGGSHQQAVGAAIIGGEVAGACQRRVNLRRRAGQRHRGAISQKIGKAEQSSRPPQARANIANPEFRPRRYGIKMMSTD
jgi:hypothetical protein